MKSVLLSVLKNNCLEPLITFQTIFCELCHLFLRIITGYSQQVCNQPRSDEYENCKEWNGYNYNYPKYPVYSGNWLRCYCTRCNSKYEVRIECKYNGKWRAEFGQLKTCQDCRRKSNNLNLSDYSPNILKIYLVGRKISNN
jgi:hypothetical protein